MKFNKFIGFQWLIFSINPVLAFITSIYFLFKNQNSLLVTSMSLSLIFIYFPLMYDTSSNFYATMQLTRIGIQNIFDIRLYNMIAYYLFNTLKINFMFIIFIYTTFIFYIWFYIFKYYATKAQNNTIIIYMIVFVLFSIIYRSIMDLNRFYLATSILLFAIFLSEVRYGEYKSKIYLYVLSVVGFLIHPSSIIFLLFYMLSKKIQSLTFYIMFPIIFLLLGLVSGEISRYLLSLPFFSSMNFLLKAGGYVAIENKWGEHSVHGYELVLRSIEIVLMFLIYYKAILLLKVNDNSRLVKLFLLLLGLVLFLLSFKSLYERYSIALFLFSSFVVYEAILQKKLKDYFLICILILVILRFIILNIVWYGMIFTEKYNTVLPNNDRKIDMVLKPFYYTSIFLLDIESNGYSNAYIRKESTRGRKYLQKNSDNPLLK